MGDRGRWRFGLLAGVFLALAAYSSLYYAVYLVVFAVVLVVQAGDRAAIQVAMACGEGYGGARADGGGGGDCADFAACGGVGA